MLRVPTVGVTAYQSLPHSARNGEGKTEAQSQHAIPNLTRCCSVLLGEGLGSVMAILASIVPLPRENGF